MDEKNTTSARQEIAAEQESDGFYVQDLDFISALAGNQAPFYMALVAAAVGFLPPEPEGKFTYCDLGCGDGTTVNALAEIYPEARFIGVDFNPGHIETARNFAAENGLENIRFEESRFSNLRVDDLPDFDFVGMNGIYSWLESQEIDAVHEFLRKRLKPGGLFYVEYTSLPGKISVQPLWSLIRYLVPEKDDIDSKDRAKKGLDLTEILAKRGMAYLNAHRPAAGGAQSYIRGRKSDEYRVDHFAHNAMAGGFRPRYFTEMYDEMLSAGLTYAGRCEFKLNEIEFSVSPAQVPTFQDYKDDIKTVELLKDYIRNEQQRHDVFVKEGALDPETANEWIDNRLYLLSRMPASGVQRFVTGMGNHRIPLRGPAFEAVIEASDQKPVSPIDVAQASGLPLERVRKAALRLLAGNQFFHCRNSSDMTVSDPANISGVQMPSRMNNRTLDLSCKRLRRNQLVSPVTGGPAVPVSAMEAVVLKAILENGGFEGAPEKATELLADETRLLPVVKGRKKGQDISTEELDEVLQAMKGRKMLNMLRLGILIAV